MEPHPQAPTTDTRRYDCVLSKYEVGTRSLSTGMYFDLTYGELKYMRRLYSGLEDESTKYNFYAYRVHSSKKLTREGKPIKPGG